MDRSIYNRSDKKSQEKNENSAPCGRERLFLFVDGQWVTKPYCSYSSCPDCRHLRLKDRGTQYINYAVERKKVKFVLVTVNFGSGNDLKKLRKKFEKSVHGSLRNKKIGVPWIKSYEDKKGLHHAHYGCVLEEDVELEKLHAVYLKFAQKYGLRAAIWKNGINVKPWDSWDKLYHYVTKFSYTTVDFLPQPGLVPNQLRHTRGLKNRLNDLYLLHPED